MKKLFMFLAVAGLATFGTACSSSDDSNPTNPETLVVTASKLTAEVGETVTFTVKEGTADVTASADIYINGTKITGKSHTGTAAGEIKVTAKKAGANDAAVVTVKFVEKGTPVKKLVLTANPTTIELNAETVFKVTLDGADVTSTATIKVGGVAVTGGKYKGTVAGAYVAIASLAGADDSAAITIIVKAADVPVPTENFLKVGSDVLGLKGTALYQYFKVGGVNYNTITYQGAVYARFDFITLNRAMNGTIKTEDFDNYIAITVYVKQSVAVGSEVTVQNVIRPWQSTNADMLFGGADGAIAGVDFVAGDQTQLSWSFVAPDTNGDGTWAFGIEGGDTEDGDTLDADFAGPFQAYYNIVAQPTTAARGVKNITSKSELMKVSKGVQNYKGAVRATK